MINNVLKSLRRIVRAMDLHSKKLVKTSGLTTAQLLLMQTVREHQSSTIGKLANEINLSQATVTTILDRLEERGLLIREADTVDKRKVFVKLTESGINKLMDSPVPLQNNFIEQFNELNEWEQTTMLSTLQRIAYMMDAQDIDAAPILHSGSIIPNLDDPS
jgi:DNA-binding MarR family transcriptional regulator